MVITPSAAPIPGATPDWIHQFAELFSVTADFAFTTDLNGVILWANSALTDLIGEPLTGQNVLVFRPAWVREVLENEARPTAARVGFWVGKTAIAPRGKVERPIHQILVAHRNSDGEVDGYSALLRDLTDTDGIAERYRVLTDTVPVGIFHNDADGRCLWVNATYTALVGRPAEAALGYGWMQSLEPESLELLAQVQSSIAANGAFGPHNIEFIRPDGERRTASVRVAPLLASDGSVAGQIGVAADITQRRIEQRSLEIAEQRFRTVLNTMNEAIVLQDETAAITFWNPAAERILGLTADELRGVTPTSRDWHAFDADGRPLPDDMHPAIVALRTGGPVTGFVMGIHKPNGDRVWLRVSSQLTTLLGRDAQRGVVTTFVDITAERNAEQALRRSERQLQVITAAARDAICLHDSNGAYTWISEGAAEVLGWPTDVLLGRNPYEMFHPDDKDRIRESHEALLAGSRPRSLTYRYRRADGTYTWVETETAVVPATDTTPLRLVTTSHSADIRIESDARSQVRQQLRSVAQFAGRLAHDFTNLYTVAHTRMEMLRERVPDELRDDVEEAFAAIERAAALTRELRALSGSDLLQSERVNVGALVAEIGEQLSRAVPKHVAVVVEAPPSAVNVLVDPLVLAEVLLAVVNNAVYAMPQGGEILLTVSTTRITQAHVDAHGEAGVGEWALLRVLDQGVGIPHERLAQLFVPTLSHKGPAVETGLGLPVGLARMRQMGGHISVSNRVEGGTEVTLWLPVVSAAARAPTQTIPAAIAPTLGDDAVRSVHVLLFDDDAMVLRATDRLLTRAGYRVTPAASEADALRALAVGAALGERIDIILTDVVMPGLSGPQFVARLRESGDTRPVVYMSGFTGDSLVGAMRPEAGAMLVSKPFSGAALLDALQAGLRKTSRDAPLPS